MMENRAGFKLGSNGIMGMIVLVLGFVALWFLAKGVFTLLSWVAPFLLVGALIVNWRTVAGYGKFIMGLFQRNWIMALALVLLTVIGFPVVAGFLFAKSFLDRKVRQMRTAHATEEQGEFVEFEEVTEEAEVIEVLELPEINEVEQAPAAEPESSYDDFFEEPRD